MTVLEMVEKYCSKSKYDDNEYACMGSFFSVEPATEEEISAFRKNCADHGVDQNAVEEMVAYFKQNKSIFNYFNCGDIGMFDWWSDDYRTIWLGCHDDDSFIYDDTTHTYAIGEAGSKDIGEYNTLMEMLEAYMKYGYEIGAN